MLALDLLAACFTWPTIRLQIATFRGLLHLPACVNSRNCLSIFGEGLWFRKAPALTVGLQVITRRDIMAVIGVQAQGNRAVDVNWPQRNLHATLEPVLAATPVDAPIVIYVHGHQLWPHPDLLEQARRQAGLAITFKWGANARYFGILPDVNSLYNEAKSAAAPLGWLINQLAVLAPNRKVDLMVHSLGARVGFEALQYLHHRNIGRFVALAAVEFSAITLAALHRPQAHNVAFYNVTSPKILIFHRLMHHFGPRPGPADRLLCRGFAFPRANWIDIQMDQPTVQRPLADLCANLAGLGSGLRNHALVAQVGAALLRYRDDTGIPDLRALLGASVPQPLSMIPLRTPKAVSRP